MPNTTNFIQFAMLRIGRDKRRIAPLRGLSNLRLHLGYAGYLWDTTTNTAEGMRGSSGFGGSSAGEKGPSGDTCNAVKNSAGKEKNTMDFMRSHQNDGPWLPYYNDCHAAVDTALIWNGLNNPGAPGGRLGDRSPAVAPPAVAPSAPKAGAPGPAVRP